MAVAESGKLAEYCAEVARKAKRAAGALQCVGGHQKNLWLRSSAALIRRQVRDLQLANQKDLEAASGYGLTDAQTDRLRLTDERIEDLARGLEEIASLPDPVGEVMESSVRPNGLEVTKVRVPLGVVFFVYESRPNVTADAAAICVKSGNAVILRGGKEAVHSSHAIVNILSTVAQSVGLPEGSVQLVSTTDRDAVGHFLRMRENIDVAIPRGGEGLIRRVAQEATMPVIKHFSGNCHVYIDAQADPYMAEQIVVNSKCQRYGVCNACESLLVHADLAAELLPKIGTVLTEEGVELRGDERTVELINSATVASEDDYSTEYLAPIISVKVVDSLDEAVRHINLYGSGHTDTIVTRDLQTAREFVARVDSSAVMVNASTRFNDGSQFGLGAEIGISTDKFHARGPCGLNELTSYKYVVYGSGHIREEISFTEASRWARKL